jgi:tetratricopeptide (TPR) repeat protein
MKLKRCLWLVIPLWMSAIVCTACAGRAAETDEAQKEHDRIASLIESLGDSSYSVRQEAEYALKSLGVKTLDQLNVAKNHPNLQVAALARYLLKSTGTIWFYEGDSPRIRKFLRSYSTDNPMERDNTINNLSTLEADEGVPALSRIARYEYNGDLSKRAALKLITMEDAYLTPEQLKRRWTTIRDVTANGNNAACAWLLHCADIYARSLAQHTGRYRQDMTSLVQDIVLPKPFSNYEYRALPLGLMKFESCSVRLVTDDQETQWWKDQIAGELQLLKIPSEDTSITIIDELCKAGCHLALRCGRKKDALELAQQLSAVPPSANDFMSIINRAIWAMDLGMPAIATDLLSDDEATGGKNAMARGDVLDMRISVRTSPFWKYHLAESYLWQGKFEDANRIASEALKSPKTDPSAGGMYIQRSLQSRMMYEWAANEYLDRSSYTDIGVFSLSMAYAQFLQDGQEFEKAFEELDKLVSKIDSDPVYADSVKQWLQRYNDFEVDDIRASTLFNKGKSQRQRGEFDAAKASFREAYKLQAENVDALIELYEMDGDEAYKKEVKAMLDDAIEKLLKDCKDHEAKMRSATSDVLITAKYDLANAMNTYAWVLCNVNRDLDTALQMSLESNRLKEQSPEYTDTLARCYYAKGDFENAVYWQERCVSLSPGHRQLLLTLLEYRQAIAPKAARN